jgi:DNA-binding HxlR family transcriptional regulator
VKRRGADQGQFYMLTARGESLRQVLASLYKWGTSHAKEYGVKVEVPMKASQLD